MGAPSVTVRLTHSAERLVRMEHPWLYAESIRSASRPGDSGDLAVIFDHKRKLLALGLWDEYVATGLDTPGLEVSVTGEGAAEVPTEAAVACPRRRG